MNHAFTKWITASPILDNLINDSFNVIIESEGSNVTIHLLPSPVVKLFVPEEDSFKFNCLYTKYIKWMESQHVFDDLTMFKFEFNVRETALQMKDIIERNFQKIYIEHHMTPKDILKGVLGIEPHCFYLPKGLQRIFDGDQVMAEFDRSEFYERPFMRLL